MIQFLGGGNLGLSLLHTQWREGAIVLHHILTLISSPRNHKLSGSSRLQVSRDFVTWATESRYDIIVPSPLCNSALSSANLITHLCVLTCLYCDTVNTAGMHLSGFEAALGLAGHMSSSSAICCYFQGTVILSHYVVLQQYMFGTST